MSDNGIIQAIQQIAGTKLKNDVTSIECTVESVNESERTCDCVAISGKAESKIPDVRLMSCIDDGLLLIPAIDSHVTVIVSKQNDPYVSLYSELQKIVFMGGEYGGLVKVTPLVQKINALEQQVNTLKQLLTAWVPVPNDGGGALKAVVSTWAAQAITLTQKAQLENLNIKHG